MYEWVKAVHVIAIIAWMAGLLYLPRLFVYHAVTPVGTPQSETFKVMERRLLKAIMTPAMIVSLVLGLWLAWLANWWLQPWFLGKMALLIGLFAMHGMMARWVKDFAADANTRPQRFYRIMNEVPTLLMIGIVILVIVKPG